MQDNFDEYERTSVPRQAASTGKRRSAHGSTWLHPVVGLRENEGQPNTDDLTQTQPIPVAVGRKALIQQPGHMHPVELGQQQRNIIDPFGLMVSGSIIPRAYLDVSISAQKVSEP
jgi:hypothetical protein